MAATETGQVGPRLPVPAALPSRMTITATPVSVMHAADDHPPVQDVAEEEEQSDAEDAAPAP